MSEQKNELQVLVDESGLEPSKAQIMLDRFSEYFQLAAEWEQKAKTIVVTGASQITEMKMARVGRLMLKEKRVELEKTRKSLKEQALREGKAIDGIANALKAVIVPIEEYLEQQEHFVEYANAAAEEARRIEADRLLAEKEEADRKAKEAEDRRVHAENLRLQKENEENARRHKAEQEETVRKLAEQTAAADKKLAAAKAKATKDRKIADEALATERRKAAVAAETARVEAEKRAAQERADLEAKHADERKAASMVTCPFCGGQFSTEDI